MEVIKYNNKYFKQDSELLALFRVHLKSFKGIKVELDYASAQEELNSFSNDPNYPIYLCIDNDEVLGYMILKMDGVIWVEQIFVKEDVRRKGVGSLLFNKA